jgi:hypothetical protein
MTSPKSSSAGALYYPYIHIQDANWLRANLIIFPCVKRMVPMNFVPGDDPSIREFANPLKDKPPLLQPANLWSDRSLRAQATLAKKLRADSKNKAFLERYGQRAARELIGQSDPGFQIHTMKLANDLRDALSEHSRLAWQPIVADGPGYVELHPRVGEAVMSTLAVACAQGEGLDIVGDKRSGPLHQCLLEKDLNSIYEAWLNPDDQMAPPSQASSEELLEFIIGIEGDPSALSAEKLYALSEERESIDALISAVREQAAKIPTMDEGPGREDAFKQAASKVMDKWKADRKNLSRFFRDFFGADSAKLGSDFLSKVADKTLTGLTGGAGGAAVAKAAVIGSSAGWVGSLSAGGVIGAGAGLVIGVIMHGASTYGKQVRREKDSPYKFLTTLEDLGVLLQSEAR